MKKFTKILALTLVLVMSVAMFASCATPNKDPKKAKEALEENGYGVELVEFEGDEIKDGCVATLFAMSEDWKNMVTILYFEDSASAKDAWEEVDEEVKELEESLGEDAKVVAKKSGKMIWFGTEDAVKAAK